MARTTIRTEDITASEVTTAKMATDPTNASNLSSGDVPLAQLGNAPATDVTGLEDDIALLGFKVASNGSLAKYNLVDQTVDDFQDTSGVNASSSANEVRDSSGKYYSGSINTTPSVSGNYNSSAVDGDYTYYVWSSVTGSGSYTTDTAQDYQYLVVAGGGGGGKQDAGAGGAGGMRDNGAYDFAVSAATHTIVVGAKGDGETSSVGPGADGSNSSFSTISSTGGGGGGTANGRDGGSGGGGGTGTRAGGSGNAGSYSPVEGYDGGDGNSGGSGAGGGGGAGAIGSDGPDGNGGNGAASSITGSSVTYAGGGGGGHGNTTSGGSGGGGAGYNMGAGTNASGYGSGGGGGGGGGGNGGNGSDGYVVIRRSTDHVAYLNMTLVSNTTAAQAAPTKGDIVLTYTNGAGTTTLDTDLTAEISADGGSTWTALALGSEGSTGSHNIATSHDVTISSTITSPWNMAYRIKTLNQAVGKQTRIQAVSLGWS